MKHLKFFACVALTGCAQFASSDDLNLNFNYGKNVNNISFNYGSSSPYAIDSSTATGDKLTVSSSYGTNSYNLKVSTKIKNDSSISQSSGLVAHEFNNYSYSKAPSDPCNIPNNPNFCTSAVGDTYYLIQLTTTKITTASYLDFWLRGTLYINKQEISSEFFMAHNNAYMTGNKNWWISNKSSGKIYEKNMSLEVRTKVQPYNYYCIQQFRNSNFEVLVSEGKCDNTSSVPYDWTNAQDEKLQFIYKFPSSKYYKVVPNNIGKEVVQFTYNQNYDAFHNGADYLKSVSDNYNDDGVQVVVKAKIYAEASTADSFKNKFNAADGLTLETNSTKINYYPSNLNFWVEGNLSINGIIIADDFTIGQTSSKKWWIGSKHGYTYINPNDKAPEMKLNGYCIKVKNQGDNIVVNDYNNTFYIFKGTCPTYKQINDAKIPEPRAT